jgi:hypothetical protein
MVLRAATYPSLLGKKVEEMNSLEAAAIITSDFPGSWGQFFIIHKIREA